MSDFTGNNADEIASIYVEACLDLRKLNKELTDLQNKRYNVNIGASTTGLATLDKQLKGIGNQKITFAIDDRAIASELANIKKQLKIAPINVGITLDRTGFDRQLTQLRSSIDPIKVDLAPDVEDFKLKLKKLGRITAVPVTLDVDKTRVKSQFIEIGRYAAEGFSQGFSSSQNAGKEAIDSMVKGVRSQLGIQSPSKVFREIGEFAAKGLEQGLNSLNVSKTIKDLEREFKNANVTVDPKVKPTDLEKSVSRAIKTGFNGAIRDLEKLNIFGFVAKLITTPIKAAFAGMNELLMLSLRPAFNALTNLFSGSRQDKSLFDGRKTTEEIDKTKKRYADLKAFLIVNPLVAVTDEKALYSLNKHLDLKEKHLKQVVAAFNNNPIKPKFESSFGSVRIAVDANSISGDIAKAVEKGVRNANSKGLISTATSTLGKGLAVIGTTIAGTVLLPLKAALTVGSTIFAGSGYKIGETLSKGIGEGLATSFKASLGQSLGSGQLVGETLGEGILEGIGGILKSKFPGILQQISEGAKSVIGEESVTASAATFRATRESQKNSQLQTGSSQVQKEFQEKIASGKPVRMKQLKSEIDAVLPGYKQEASQFTKEFAAEKARLTQIADKFTVSFTPEQLIKKRVKDYENQLKQYEALAAKLESQGRMGDASKIRSAISALPKPSEDASKITTGELRQAEASELANTRAYYINSRLNQQFGTRQKALNQTKSYLAPRQSEYSQLNSELNSAARNLEILKVAPKAQQIQNPRIYNQVLQEVLQASGISNVDPGKLPTLNATNKLSDKTIATYSPERNQVNLRPEMLAKLQSGKASSAEIKALVHELRHAVQFEFGQKNLVGLSQPGSKAGANLLTPNSSEIGKFGRQIEGSTSVQPEPLRPITRRLEADAYTFENRYSPGIQKNIERSTAIEGFESRLGIGGIKATTIAKTTQIEAIKRIHKIAQTAVSFGVDLEKESQHTLAQLDEISSRITPLLERASNLELLDPADINNIQQEIEEFLNSTSELMTSAGDQLRDGLKAKLEAPKVAETASLSKDNEVNLNRLNMTDVRKVAKQLGISTYNKDEKRQLRKSELVSATLASVDPQKLQSVLPAVGQPNAAALDQAKKLLSLPQVELQRNVKFVTGQLTQAFQNNQGDKSGLKAVLNEIRTQQDIVKQALAQNINDEAKGQLEALKLNLAQLQYKAKGQLGKLNLFQGRTQSKSSSVNSSVGGNSMDLASVTDDIEAVLQQAKARVGRVISRMSPDKTTIPTFRLGLKALAQETEANNETEKTRQAVEASRKLIESKARQVQQQTQINQKLKELENKPFSPKLTNSVNEQIIQESLAKEAARQQAQNKFLSNPVGAIKQRLYNSSVSKARYLTENAEGIAGLVGSKIGSDPSPKQAKNLVELQTAFGNLGEAATKFGENNTDENFKNLNKATNELERSLKSLGIPFTFINKEIEDYTNKLKNLQSKGDIDINVDVESLAPEKFSFLDNIISKFNQLESTGVGALLNIGKGFLAFQAISRVLPLLTQFAQQSLQVAANFESLYNQVKFVSGSSSTGSKNISVLSQQSKDLRLDRASVLGGSAGFLASTEGTSLEGDQSTKMLQNFNVFMRARNVDKERQKLALVAISQMASKGTIQSEELKGQLAEALPGSYQIFARSQGLSVNQLGNKLKRGEIGSESLVQFGQQAYSENITNIPESLNTVQASTQRLDNSIIDLHESVGKALLPMQKLSLNTLAGSLEVVNSHGKEFIALLQFTAFWAAKPVFDLMVKGAIALSAKLGMVALSSAMANMSIMSLGLNLGNAAKAMKGLAVEFAAFYAISRLVEVTKNQFSDLSGEIGGKVTQQSGAIEQYRKIQTPERVDNSKTPDWLLALTRIAGGNGLFGEATAKIVDDTEIQSSKNTDNFKFIQNEVNSGNLNNGIQQVSGLDVELKNNQIRQRALLQTNSKDVEGLRKLKAEEKTLVDQRQQAIKPVAQMQSNVSSQMEVTKSLIDNLTTLRANPNLASFEIKGIDRQITTAKEQLESLVTIEDNLTKAVGKTAKAFDILKKQVQETGVELEDNKIKIELTATASKLGLYSGVAGGSITQGNQQFLNSSLDIRTQQQQRNNLQSSIKQNSALMGTEEAQRVLKGFGVNESTGINKINYLAENTENALDKFILQEFSKLQQAKKDLSASDLQIMESRANLAQQLREQTKQVAEYYQGISRQVKESAIEFKKQLNTINTTKAQNSIRAALIGVGDNIFTQFADGLIQNLQELNDIKNSKLDAQSKAQSVQFQIEDAQKQGLELSRSLPGNFKGFDTATIQNLNGELGNTQDIVSLIQNGTEQLDNLLNDNINSTGNLTSEFNKTLDSTKDLEYCTNDWKNSLTSIPGTLSNLDMSFQGIGSTIANVATQTTTWIGSLLNGQGMLSNIASGAISAFNGTNPQVQQIPGIQGGIDAVKGFFNPTIKSQPFKIMESVGGSTQNVNSFADLEKHHPSSGREAGRHYDHIDGDLEEIRKTSDGRTLIKKDFVLMDSKGRQNVNLPAPASGFAKANSNFGTVDIYKDEKMTQLVAKALHLSNIQVKTGDYVRYGQNIGTQDGIGAGGKKSYAVHSHVELEKENFVKYIADLKRGLFEASNGSQPSNNAVNFTRNSNMVDTRQPKGARFSNNVVKGQNEGIFNQGGMSDTLIGLVKEKEGFHKKAYWDYGQNSVGFGTRAKSANESVSVEEANVRLFQELKKAQAEVMSLVKVKISSNQLDALTSFQYNTGGLGKSTLLKKLNAGDNPGASNEFTKWVKADGQVLPGLVKRRNQEKDLFNSSGNSAMSAYQNNQFLNPNQLQSIVQNGTEQQQVRLYQQNAITQAQSQAETRQRELEFQRKNANALRTFTRGGRDITDSAIQSGREVEDAQNSLSPNKSTYESFKIEAQNVIRKYDDLIKERSRKIEDSTEAVNAGNALLATGTLTGDAKAAAEKNLAASVNQKAQMESDLQKLIKLKDEAIAESEAVFSKQETFRQQSIAFEEDSAAIGKLQAKVEEFKAVVQLNPLAKEALEIPNLERQIQLKQTDLETEKAIADIEQKRFKKELTDDQANKAIESAKKLSIQKQVNIDLTNAQANAEAKLNQMTQQANQQQRERQVINDGLSLQIEAIENKQRRNPLEGDTLPLQRDMKLNELANGYGQKKLEILGDRTLTEDQRKGRLIQESGFNSQRVQNLQEKFKIDSEEQAIKDIETANERAKTKTDFLTGSKFDRKQMEIDAYKARGGNEFVANASSRALGKEQEDIRYQQQLADFEAQQAKLKFQGIDVDPEALASVRADMEAIHNLNMDKLNSDFKTFGMSLDEIARNSIQSLGKGITGLIMGTKSLNDVLDEFFNNILSSVLDQAMSSMLGGLFGGGMGGSGGGLGGLLGGLFYNGGMVGNYAYGGNVQDAFSKERSQSGRKPVLVVAHEGEMMIPAWRANQLASMGLGEKELLGYADGGVIGNLKQPAANRASQEPLDIKYQSTVINNQSYVTAEQFEEGVRKAAQAGAEGGFNKVQSKLSNSSSFRRSVGI